MLKKGAIWLLEALVLGALAIIFEHYANVQSAIAVFVFGIALLVYLHNFEGLSEFAKRRPWMALLALTLIPALLGFSLWLWMRFYLPSGAEAKSANRQTLVVQLSQEKINRIKVYRDDFVTNLNMNAMEYELRNPFLHTAGRQFAEQKRDEFLAHTNNTYEAAESEEKTFNGLLEQIKLAFPDSPSLRQKLEIAAKRPVYTVEVPTNPPYPDDDGKRFLDTEGDKINQVLKRECEEPINNLLAELNAIVSGH
jgi:hypothetical protein